MKLKPEDLDKIGEKMRATTQLRNGAGDVKITVHMGTCGIASGAREILAAFLKRVNDSAQEGGKVILTTSGCAGLCSSEPMATVELKGEAPVKYVDLTPEKVETVFDQHVLQGEIVGEYALARGSERQS